MNHCLRHLEEPSTGECRSCHGTFCARCLVFSFGPKKPPFCVGCALVASGVRNGSRRVHQPQANAASVPGSFEAAPALFTDDTHGGRPGEPPTPGGTATVSAQAVKSSWSNRRAQRQATKAARRSAQEPGNVAVAEPRPIDAQHLEPLLSPTQRKALGRLSASNF